MKRLFLLICFLLSLSCMAQNVVQPKIMVIPYTKEGEDIRTILETDANKRIILSKVKEAFDERGFTTIDFVARLKAASTAEVMQMDNQSDIKSSIIEMSGADIYVEAEMICTQNRVSGQNYPESRVKINLTAYDCATGASLANKIGESGIFYTNDIAKLSMRAVSSIADDFLNVMQSKFSEMSESGRSIMLFITLDSGSKLTLESPIGSNGLLLQDEIELWIDENSYNNYYHLQGVTSLNMVFDEIKLPLIDEATGNPYTASKFSMELLKFFRNLGVSISRSIKGNTIYITVR